jgi:hypothetical protein
MGNWAQFWQEIAARPAGPLALRFYLQPLMATLLAVRDGLADARHGKPAYLWSLATDPAHRRERLREGWGSICKVVIIALILDLTYQIFVLHGHRPFQALLVAALLAVIPYAVLRGPVNRIASRTGGRGSASRPAA